MNEIESTWKANGDGMTERERLIELLKNAKLCSYTFGDQYSDSTIGKIADHLLANGVIVPPCKVGDDLYYPWVYGGTSGIAILEADAIKSYVQGRSMVFFKNPESDMRMQSYFREEDFGRIVFLTREEAEKALAERSKT